MIDCVLCSLVSFTDSNVFSVWLWLDSDAVVLKWISITCCRYSNSFCDGFGLYFCLILWFFSICRQICLDLFSYYFSVLTFLEFFEEYLSQFISVIWQLFNDTPNKCTDISSLKIIYGNLLLKIEYEKIEIRYAFEVRKECLKKFKKKSNIYKKTKFSQ